MKITLEQIDLLRQRADVSYKEAKEALERSEGDIVEALAYLEETNKIRPEREKTISSMGQKAKKMYTKGNGIRLDISKDNTPLLNIGLPLGLLVTIIAFPLVVALIVLALLTGCKMKFVRNDGKEYSINDGIDNIARKAEDFAGKAAE